MLITDTRHALESFICPNSLSLRWESQNAEQTITPASIPEWRARQKGRTCAAPAVHSDPELCHRLTFIYCTHIISLATAAYSSNCPSQSQQDGEGDKRASMNPGELLVTQFCLAHSALSDKGPTCTQHWCGFRDASVFHATLLVHMCAPPVAQSVYSSGEKASSKHTGRNTKWLRKNKCMESCLR